MRIIVANNFYYNRGGDSSQFISVYTELGRRGHAVAAFSMQHPQNLASSWSEYWVPHVEYRGQLTAMARARAGWRSIHSFESGRQMRRLIKDFAPDLVHFHGVHHHLTLAAVDACLAAGIPVVWTLHDHRIVCPASLLLRRGQVCERCAGGQFWHCAVWRCKSGELSRSLAAVVESYATRVRSTLSAVDCYVAPSRYLARKVLQMGLPARRVELAPNPIAAIGESTRRARRRGVLYVGRLSPEKGVDCLIRALSSLEGVNLQVLGDGPDASRLEALAKDLDVDVGFLGWVDPDVVRSRMQEAELLCVPSLCCEACGMVALEAMAAGLPVVASDLGGLVELLDRGRAGWPVPPGDAGAWRRVIREALDDPKRAAGKAALAQTRVQAHHDPQAYFDRLEAIYRSVAH